jgi:hypothetical protein
MNCLSCNRVFPDKFQGEIEPGGNCLCLQCGHVMAWTDALALRELTEKERLEAGGNFDLMRARAKVVAHRAIRHRGSWATTCCVSLILIMVILERVGIVGPIHPPTTPMAHGLQHGR